ncbi:hypothetical protein [Caenimonas koreensis]|uniref:Uncharacterized protein n=1 Tax=Caenimonas koreensis DSM 17982 TaxID=1121255 RepID=A0A844AW11_9BURK|nr:hypothetical protein [Caenimonas koreensis]MRD48700.1 hypothetical protein [Caenimonas koreensis DSM 17982]
MTAVDPASQLAALIRAQVGFARSRRAGGKVASGARTRRKPQVAHASGDLSSAVAVRIRSIGRDDPDRASKALRMFLETVVMAELGPDIANDPNFAVMLDHVEHQLDSDAEIALAAQQAAKFLLQTADATNADGYASPG